MGGKIGKKKLKELNEKRKAGTIRKSDLPG